jgi:DNA modification methylase
MTGEALPYKRREVVGDCTLYWGDCLHVMHALERVDHIITDPPYSDHVHSKARRGGKNTIAEDGWNASYARVAHLGFDAIKEYQRAHCARLFAKLSRRWILAFSDLESCHLWREQFVNAGLDYCRTGIWRKLNATPQFTGDRPAVACETITIAHPRGRKRWNGGGAHAFWEVAIEINRNWKTPRLHTTQKPLPLMAALIRDFTDAGETILDPFMGSATTGIACVKLGRKFIGVEKDEHYFDVAVERISDAYAQADLFVPAPPPARQKALL